MTRNKLLRLIVAALERQYSSVLYWSLDQLSRDTGVTFVTYWEENGPHHDGNSKTPFNSTHEALLEALARCEPMDRSIIIAAWKAKHDSQ